MTPVDTFMKYNRNPIFLEGDRKFRQTRKAWRTVEDDEIMTAEHGETCPCCVEKCNVEFDNEEDKEDTVPA